LMTAIVPSTFTAKRWSWLQAYWVPVRPANVEIGRHVSLHV